MKRMVVLAVGLGINMSALAWAIAEKPHYERQVSADYVHGQNNDDNTQEDHRSDQDRNTGGYQSSLRFGWQIESDRGEQKQ